MNVNSNLGARTGTTRLSHTRRATMLGILTGIAYVVMAVGRIPMVMFLKYDPKDVVIIIGGFLFGPLSAFLISLVVSLVEMVTVSDNGPWGLLMNVLSSCAFACTAALVYKRRQTLKGAVTGLVTGLLLMTAVMMLWNYLITPIYTGMQREMIRDMLLPVFLPFNLLKGAINTTLVLLLYKPLVRALRAANLLPPRDDEIAAQDGTAGKKAAVGVSLVSLLVLVSCVLIVLVFQGVI